jgi:hypothetical protein
MWFVRELLGKEDAPAEIALGPFGGSGRLGLMLKFDAISVSASRGIGPVDSQRILAGPHRLGHDFDVVVLGRGPTPLLGGAGFEVAAPENFGRERTG